MVRVEINRDYNTIENINETKSWFSEKISKFDKPLASHTRKIERGFK